MSKDGPTQAVPLLNTPPPLPTVSRVLLRKPNALDAGAYQIHKSPPGFQLLSMSPDHSTSPAGGADCATSVVVFGDFKTHWNPPSAIAAATKPAVRQTRLKNRKEIWDCSIRVTPFSVNSLSLGRAPAL